MSTKKQAQCSQAVTAKIVDVKTYQSSDSGFSYAAVCEFSLNGMLYRKTSAIYTGKQPAVGIKVKLFVNHYNIDMFVNPETNDYLKRKYKIVGKIVLGVDALVFIITIIAVIVRLA